VDEFELVHSLDRGVVASTQWTELRSLFCDPNLTLVVSNTTEQGLSRDPGDAHCRFREECPVSFPAKLTALLWMRFQQQLPGLTILPMELIEGNGHVLRQLVQDQAIEWMGADQREFLDWLLAQNRWLCNLVDRIVVGVTEPTPWEGEDPLAVVTEPYRLLAIADDGGPRDVLPEHPMVQWVADLRPLFERKVRILNGLHTAMVAWALPLGFETVLDVVQNEEQRGRLEALLQEEILPVLRPRIEGIDDYASTVLERFENPFFRHRLRDIAVNHEIKLQTRLWPTCREYEQQFGRAPRYLTQLLQAKIG
jgi:tagaturonate reductase